jgi:hypothetical protein
MKEIKYNNYESLNKSNINQFIEMLTEKNELMLIQSGSFQVIDQIFNFQDDCMGLFVRWVDDHGIERITMVRHLGEGKFEEKSYREWPIRR